jgi:hypothetical protein
VAVLHLEVTGIVGDRVEFRDREGRGVFVQGLPGEGSKWKVGDKYRLGAPPKRKR